MEVKLTTEESIKRLYNSSDSVYRVTSPRGRAFIIHNDEFDMKANADQSLLDDRIGSEYDLAKLQAVFKALDFVVITQENLSSQDILRMVEKETKEQEHENYGMFIMIILSHGDDGAIFGNDARKIAINDIERRLSPKNFPGMAGKPKLLIIQACAGSEADNTFQGGVKGDEPSVSDRVTRQNRVKKPQSTKTDLLTLRSCCPGYKSFRREDFGTYMIQSLVKILQNDACHENIHDIIVKVRNEVLRLCDEHNDDAHGVQTVHSTETLTKKLFFFPGLPASYTSNSAGVELTQEDITASADLLAPVTARVPVVHRRNKKCSGSGSGVRPNTISGRLEQCRISALDISFDIQDSTRLNRTAEPFYRQQIAAILDEEVVMAETQNYTPPTFDEQKGPSAGVYEGPQEPLYENVELLYPAGRLQGQSHIGEESEDIIDGPRDDESLESGDVQSYDLYQYSQDPNTAQAFATALYPYRANVDRGEIDILEHEVLTIIEDDQFGWTKVRNIKNEEGYVPSSYIQKH